MVFLEQFFKIKKVKTLDTHAHLCNHICIQFNLLFEIFFYYNVQLKLSAFSHCPPIFEGVDRG